MTNLTDEQLDKIIKDEIQPDIVNDNSVDKSVEQHLGEMGFLWDRVQKKLYEDGICFKCKNLIEKETPLHVLQITKTDKGVCAFCGVCDNCFKEIEAKNNSKNKPKKNDKL